MARRSIRKSKWAIIPASIFVLVWGIGGSYFFAREAYDYYVADDCRAELSAAITEGVNANSAVNTDDPKLAAQGYADTARAFAEAVAAIKCPTTIAPVQDDLVKALYAYVAVQEKQATTGATIDERAYATERVGDALRALTALGVE